MSNNALLLEYTRSIDIYINGNYFYYIHTTPKQKDYINIAVFKRRLKTLNGERIGFITVVDMHDYESKINLKIEFKNFIQNYLEN